MAKLADYLAIDCVDLHDDIHYTFKTIHTKDIMLGATLHVDPSIG